ncbi:hypothetical protein N7481_006282 [Penicillium waksmanii]|uniref:uncharacterized protein n=1 Tax=Penicillium waksmanii TaxID=69791 RepID=UPI002548C494|nr:uncharacterized protein N7481_006282 [Penicillium waksmanii]KAJ5984183.1 hypothetical protein N7481_006282 [Penicillium waksmanii]
MDDSRVSAYKGGYSANVRRTVDSIELPEWLTCCLCGIRQSKTWYSKASLAALRQRIYREGNQILIANHAGLIRCCDCSGNPAQSERKCKICAELKSLDAFARNQRQYAEPNVNTGVVSSGGTRIWVQIKRSRDLPPAPRRRLALPVGENDNGSGFIAEPSPLPQGRLMHQNALGTESGSTQPPTGERAYETASSRATAPRLPRVEGDDEIRSTASSTLVSNDGFLLAPEYGSDDDTIAPRAERSRTGWSKIRPNRHRRGHPE